MADPLYVVTFPDPVTKRMVTLKVREIGDSGLGPMFARLSGFVFQDSGKIINPNNDGLSRRYQDTKAIHVNRMALAQVEEVAGEPVELSEMPNVVQFHPPDA